MSVAALTWAFAQKIESSAKFVLVALADYANEQLTVYPSIQALQEKTCLERKTIFKAITALKESGFLEDTGERAGTTKQIRVYRLKGCQMWNSSKSGTVPLFLGNSAKNGTGKQCQKRHTEPSVQEPSIEPLVAVASQPLNWLEQLRAIYTWVNFDREVAKARAWLLKPGCKGRSFTQTYFTAWLNRIERPLEPPEREWRPPEKSWKEHNDDNDEDSR